MAATSGIFQPIMAAFGLISNVIQGTKQNASLDKTLSYQKDPAKFAQLVNSLTQPLSQGLTQSVGNNVQGYLGERGLSESPNLTADVLAQALGPYQQQSQQMGINEAMALINPAGAGFGQPVNLAQLFSSFNKPAMLPGQTGTSGGYGLPGGPGGAIPPEYGGGTGTSDYTGGSGGGDIVDSPINPYDSYGIAA